jgi:hypothetical protein
MTKKTDICYLCGETIDLAPSDPNLERSRDHVPPQQFYPKELRPQKGLNLQRLPTHKKCNEAYRKDEEYFYHAMYPMVRSGNAGMAALIHRDFVRRAHKPQTPAMMRRLRRNFCFVTDGGIHLPPGVVKYSVDDHRIQRVVLKIARGLLYTVAGRYMPLENAKDIRLCLEEREVPELYHLAWKARPARGVYQKVFSYRHFEFDGLHLLSMLFWEAFMFCVAFEESED